MNLPSDDVEVELLQIDESEIRGRLTSLSAKNDPSLRVIFHARFP